MDSSSGRRRPTGRWDQRAVAAAGRRAGGQQRKLKGWQSAPWQPVPWERMETCGKLAIRSLQQTPACRAAASLFVSCGDADCGEQGTRQEQRPAEGLEGPPARGIPQRQHAREEESHRGAGEGADESHHLHRCSTGGSGGRAQGAQGKARGSRQRRLERHSHARAGEAVKSTQSTAASAGRLGRCGGPPLGRPRRWRWPTGR